MLDAKAESVALDTNVALDAVELDTAELDTDAEPSPLFRPLRWSAVKTAPSLSVGTSKVTWRRRDVDAEEVVAAEEVIAPESTPEAIAAEEAVSPEAVRIGRAGVAVVENVKGRGSEDSGEGGDDRTGEDNVALADIGGGD